MQVIEASYPQTMEDMFSLQIRALPLHLTFLDVAKNFHSLDQAFPSSGPRIEILFFDPISTDLAQTTLLPPIVPIGQFS